MPRTLAKPPSQWLHHASSGCHLPIASGRGPTELWEIAKVMMCIFTSEWPQVGTIGVFKASQTLQWFLTDTWDWLLYELLNRNQRNFFCTYFCNKQNCPIKWINESINQWKSVPPWRKHARIFFLKKKRWRHTVFKQTSWDIFFGSRFERKGWDKNENTEEPPWLLLRLTTHMVIWKLKIVFNLCLCSFSKEHGTEQQKPQQLQYQRWGFSQLLFQFIISFCLAKILIASLICTKVIDFVSLSNKRKGSRVWFYCFPLILFCGFLPQRGIYPKVPWLQV